MQAKRAIQVNGWSPTVHPVYRVDYWQQPRPDLAWNLDSWLLLDCSDVLAVISWAHAHAEGRRFQVLVSCDPEVAEAPFALLLGDDPNDDRHRTAQPDWGFVPLDGSE